jgi:hypothetical protein
MRGYDSAGINNGVTIDLCLFTQSSLNPLAGSPMPDHWSTPGNCIVTP